MGKSAYTRDMRHLSFPLNYLCIIALTVLTLAGWNSPAWSELDTIYLANGQVLQCKVKEITGDFISIKTTTGATTLLKRIELASRRDILQTNRGNQYSGEVKLLGSFIIEMFTDQGQKEIWRIYKKKLTLGIPKEQFPKDFVESDSLPERTQHLFPDPPYTQFKN